jgi:succinyl-CoA synthetase beta subunit
MKYVCLDGIIGCVANGTGLAMATADILSLKGGSPANFLDIGRGASKIEPIQVKTALDILNSDQRVKSILVNIFAGDMRCNDIATWIIDAVESFRNTKPTVVRLEGFRIEEAKKLIDASGPKVILAAGLEDAAEKAVVAAHTVT